MREGAPVNLAVLPWPPKACQPNARVHYLQRHREGKAYAALASYHGQGQQRLLLPVLAILPVVKDQRRRDLDNALAGLKSALDGLTRSGWWNDDSDIVRIVIQPALRVGKTLERNSVIIMAVEQGTSDGSEDLITQIRFNLTHSDNINQTLRSKSCLISLNNPTPNPPK